MSDKTFTLMATTTASTKRSPSASGGIVGAATTNISSLACFPLDPVDPELRQRIPRLAGMQELLETYVQGGLDIVEGDLLVVSGTEYPIRAVEDWYWAPDGENYLRLILEEPK